MCEIIDMSGVGVDCRSLLGAWGTTMATVDIEGVKTLMAQMEARQTKWLLGIMTAAAVSVVVAFVRSSTG